MSKGYAQALPEFHRLLLPVQGLVQIAGPALIECLGPSLHLPGCLFQLLRKEELFLLQSPPGHLPEGIQGICRQLSIGWDVGSLRRQSIQRLLHAAAKQCLSFLLRYRTLSGGR